MSGRRPGLVGGFWTRSLDAVEHERVTVEIEDPLGRARSPEAADLVEDPESSRELRDSGGSGAGALPASSGCRGGCDRRASSRAGGAGGAGRLTGGDRKDAADVADGAVGAAFAGRCWRHEPSPVEASVWSEREAGTRLAASVTGRCGLRIARRVRARKGLPAMRRRARSRAVLRGARSGAPSSCEDLRGCPPGEAPCDAHGARAARREVRRGVRAIAALWTADAGAENSDLTITRAAPREP